VLFLFVVFFLVTTPLSEVGTTWWGWFVGGWALCGLEPVLWTRHSFIIVYHQWCTSRLRSRSRKLILDVYAVTCDLCTLPVGQPSYRLRNIWISSSHKVARDGRTQPGAGCPALGAESSRVRGFRRPYGIARDTAPPLVNSTHLSPPQVGYWLSGERC